MGRKRGRGRPKGTTKKNGIAYITFKKPIAIGRIAVEGFHRDRISVKAKCYKCGSKLVLETSRYAGECEGCRTSYKGPKCSG